MMKFLVNFLFIVLNVSVYGQELKFDKFNFVTDSINYELKYAYNQPTIEKPPLLIYLHGVEGRGNDINKALSNSPFVLGEKLKIQDEFMIITPQTYRPIDWHEDVVDALISHLVKTKKFDKQKIFLTGISMGEMVFSNTSQNIRIKFLQLLLLQDGEILNKHVN
ncbi:hypothetical protein [Mangrovivirga cuniculi]|uniref:hypothetical protein n=1 Tax=Mangrovivirga cuniculi TaxID=2715131 RepID=UPI0015860A24|nr:hypothetical protein [Mangrovivirga cuniculi]